jgi:AraC-like DNA-binding protein
MHAFERDDVRGDGGAVCAALRSRTARRPGRRAPVTHQFAALVYCSSGRAVVELPDRWILDPGDVLLVPAGRPHRFAEMDRFGWCEVAVCVACVPPGDSGSLLQAFERVRAGGSPVIRIPPERRPFLAGLLRELIETNAAGGEDSAIVRRSLLHLVLHEVGRAARGQVDPGGRPGVVVDALRFIERNCLRRLSLVEVARAVGRSPAYVTSALARATGRSAVAWITAGRMAEARRHLLHSDEMVDVIAERVGYADPTHFIRTFRREHGATPAAWRASQRRSKRR